MASPDEFGNGQNGSPEGETTFETDRILDAREEIEFLREQVESLQLELRSKEWEIQQLEEELEDTNRDLREALRSENAEIAEALELARTLVEREAPLAEALAELLNAVFGFSVEPWQLLRRVIEPVTLSPCSQTDRGNVFVEVEKLKANASQARQGLFLLRNHLARLKSDLQQSIIQRNSLQPPASLGELGGGSKNEPEKGV